MREKTIVIIGLHFTGQFFRPVEKFERIVQHFRSVHTVLRRARSLNVRTVLVERNTYNTLEVSTGRKFVRGGGGGGEVDKRIGWHTFYVMITYICPKAPYIDFESMTVATILELSCTTQKKWNLISRNQSNLLLNIFPCIKIAKDETRKSYELDILAEHRPLRSTKCFLQF